MIYFILAAEISRLKIGVAADPWARLSKMQSDCPCDLTMLSICGGEVEDERALHIRFGVDRVRGEWFTYSEALSAHVATLPAAIRPIPARDARVTNFAAQAGISQSYASMILNGARKPGLKRLVSIFVQTGERFGKLADASNEEIETLARIYGVAA